MGAADLHAALLTGQMRAVQLVLDALVEPVLRALGVIG